MPGKFYKLLIAALCLLALCSAANGQQAAGVNKQSTTTQVLNLTGKAAGVKKQSTTTQVLNMTGKVAVIVVGQTAKAAWKTTKFTAAEVGKRRPGYLSQGRRAKSHRVSFQAHGKGHSERIPIGQKLFVTYLTTRFDLIGIGIWRAQHPLFLRSKGPELCDPAGLIHILPFPRVALVSLADPGFIVCPRWGGKTNHEPI